MIGFIFKAVWCPQHWLNQDRGLFYIHKLQKYQEKSWIVICIAWKKFLFFSWQQKVAEIQNPKWPPIHLLIPIFASAICTPSTLHFLWAWLQGNRQILLSGFFPLRGGVTPQCCSEKRAKNMLTLFGPAYFDVSVTGGGAYCAPPKYLWVGEG